MVSLLQFASSVAPTLTLSGVPSWRIMELELTTGHTNLGSWECPGGVCIAGFQGLCVLRKEPKAPVCVLPVDQGTDNALAWFFCFVYLFLFCFCRQS